jgi:O-antigen/teichoic acid export membrane protein
MSAAPEGGGLATQLRKLAGHSALYGSADVVSQIVNLALTPLYTAFLSPRDYGVLAVLFLFSSVSKILFRMGLDAGFFRVYYDQENEGDRRRLAGTVAGFAVAAGTALFVVLALGAPLLGRALLGPEVTEAGRLVTLAAADVYLGVFAFVPLALLRIEDRPGTFATLIAGRNLLNTLLKVGLVVGGFGVSGVLWSDVLATFALSVALGPVLVRGAQPALVLPMLREVLGFGLPKAPHGFLLQLLNLADRRILSHFRGLDVVGVYDKGYVLGAGVKFALSAFEPAWQPFVYAQIGRPDAPRTLARLATYAWLAFTTFGLGVAVFGRELLMALTFTNPAFWSGASIVPVVTLAYLLHGFFLLTSIGIGIEKKTRYYPLITACAAVTNLLANFALIPPFGMLGAAWATVASYAVMAGLGLRLSQRVYPLALEAGRLARISVAAVAVFGISLLAPATLGLAVLVKSAACAAFPVLLLLLGFPTTAERALVREAGLRGASRLRGRR